MKKNGFSMCFLGKFKSPTHRLKIASMFCSFSFVCRKKPGHAKRRLFAVWFITNKKCINISFFSVKKLCKLNNKHISRARNWMRNYRIPACQLHLTSSSRRFLDLYNQKAYIYTLNLVQRGNFGQSCKVSTSLNYPVNEGFHSTAYLYAFCV